MQNWKKLIASVGLTVLAASVAAAPSAGAQSAATECSEAQSLAGECFVGYVSPGESPEAAVVKSAIMGGYADAALKYVQRYANSRTPALQAELQSLLTADLTVHFNGGSDGTPINSREWNLNTTEDLQVCFDTCTIIDTVSIQYRVSGYRTGELLLAGQIASQGGKKVTVTNHSCEVYQDIPYFVDPQVGFFSSCQTFTDAASYQILESSSSSYLARTNDYIRINVVLMPGTGNSNAVLKIPKNLNYESQNFASDSGRTINWMAS